MCVRVGRTSGQQKTSTSYTVGSTLTWSSGPSRFQVAARWRVVLPSWLSMSMPAPALSIALTTILCPRQQACMRGVQPLTSCASKSAPAAISSCTMSMCPSCAALRVHKEKEKMCVLLVSINRCPKSATLHKVADLDRLELPISSRRGREGERQGRCQTECFS